MKEIRFRFPLGLQECAASDKASYISPQGLTSTTTHRYNSSKIQESWLKIMRSAKTKQLKREVEIIAQSHERDMDRKDAIMQMYLLCPHDRPTDFCVGVLPYGYFFHAAVVVL